MSQQTSQQAFVPLGDETRARLARCGAATLANCSVSYTAPSAANGQPTVAATTSGC